MSANKQGKFLVKQKNVGWIREGGYAQDKPYHFDTLAEAREAVVESDDFDRVLGDSGKSRYTIYMVIDVVEPRG